MAEVKIDTPANNKIAEGAFGLLIIASLLWLAGNLVYYVWNGLSIPWGVLFLPLFFVMAVQFVFVWIGAVIRKSVAEGMVLGFTQLAILEAQQANRKSERVH